MRGKLMKIKSMLSCGFLALVTASTAYAADKYPLDPAYAANKKAMADATKYEEANLPKTAPSSGGEQWRLLYSGSGVSSVNLPTGTKFVSVDFGNGLKVYPVEKNMNEMLVDKFNYQTESCQQQAQGSQWCDTTTHTGYLYVSYNKVRSQRYSYPTSSDKLITKIYSM